LILSVESCKGYLSGASLKDESFGERHVAGRRRASHPTRPQSSVYLFLFLK